MRGFFYDDTKINFSRFVYPKSDFWVLHGISQKMGLRPSKLNKTRPLSIFSKFLPNFSIDDFSKCSAQQLQCTPLYKIIKNVNNLAKEIKKSLYSTWLQPISPWYTADNRNPGFRYQSRLRISKPGFFGYVPLPTLIYLLSLICLTI